jgi:Family of unknown function (DUF5927)/Core-2/I-Branching enzyme
VSIGFIMLCHNSLDRAAQVARRLVRDGCPVVIHLDSRVTAERRAAFAVGLADLADLRIISTQACEWGTWRIVQATQEAATLMLRDFPEVRHVYLASGSCLPLRPVASLKAYLDERADTDFIESITTEDVGWTVGGLNIERFTLRFPFSWRRNRRLFDFYVRLQRRVGFQRRIPAGISPHLGSQWWCLTRDTLSAILDAPQRAARDRYFRRVWIPDEAYFQTLARQYSRKIESRSLTLSKFDYQGKPHVFYDDHLQLLRRSDCFVARKIWPEAEKLYAAFLSDDPSVGATGDPNPGKIDRLFSKAVERRVKGRAGLYMQSRFPLGHVENGKTAAPYTVLQGFSDLFENFETWLGKTTGTRVHGHLFAPERADFAGGEAVFNGALSDSAALRDYNPKAFLTNLIWNTRGERQFFQFGPKDNQAIVPFVASDANARVLVISGAWALTLFRQNAAFGALRKEAARLQKIETEELAILRQMPVKARVRVWTLAEFIENTMENLQEVVDDFTPNSARKLTEAPRMADLTGFGQFLQNLRNEGMQPVLTGDFPTGDVMPAAPRRGRPTLVK